MVVVAVAIGGNISIIVELVQVRFYPEAFGQRGSGIARRRKIVLAYALERFPTAATFTFVLEFFIFYFSFLTLINRYF